MSSIATERSTAERSAAASGRSAYPVLGRITRGEFLTLLGVAVFSELLTVGWIVALVGGEGGQATWAQSIGLAAADLLSLAWLPVPLFFWFDRHPLTGEQRSRNLLLRALGATLLLPISAWASGAASRYAGMWFGVPHDVLAAIDATGFPEDLFWSSCNMFGASMAYLILRRLHDARDLEQRHGELQRLALEAQLSALAAELRPHFLFNALNNLAELVHQDPARAEAMLLHLSSLLQASLTTHRQRTVPLSQELALVNDYLAVQQMRFEDRLQVRMDVDDALLGAPVPPMLLQPLVENAVVHGIEGRVGASMLHLSVRAVAGGLEVQLDDDGPGPLGSSRQGTGTGLRNVHERLAALYGTAAKVALTARPEGGSRVSLRLPLEEA